jgi:hypothetical protein
LRLAGLSPFPFSGILFGRSFCGFCRGFWRKRVFGRGFLMVNLWWDRGDLWCVDGCILGLKNLPLFKDLF